MADAEAKRADGLLRALARGEPFAPAVPAHAPAGDEGRAARALGLMEARLRATIDELRAIPPADRDEEALRAVGRLAAAAYALRATASWVERSPADAAVLPPLVDRVAVSALREASPPGGGPDELGPEPEGALAAVARAWEGDRGEVARGSAWSVLLATVRDRLARAIRPPTFPVSSPMLRPFGDAVARRAERFGRAVAARSDPERLAAAAVELAASSCALARLDAAVASGAAGPDDHAAAELFLREAGGRFDALLGGRPRDSGREAAEAGRALLRPRLRPTPPAGP